MGKALLIFLLGSMAIFGVINIFNNNNIKNALNTSVSYYSDTQARNIGNSAMQMILSQLSDSNSWRVPSASPLTINLLNGSAQYYIKDTSFAGDSLVKVNVYANYRGTKKTITSYFHTPVATIPSFMNYAVLSGSSLSISGNVEIVPAAGYSGNANVQVNGNVSVSGNAASIDGFLTYSGTAIGSNLDHIVNPVVNPNGLPDYSQGPVVPIPTFNPDNYKAIATTTYAGNKTLIGPVTLGTKSSPAIIYVGGNLTLSTATFTGYGIILVKGNVSLSGNNKLTTIDPQGSSLGLYIAGGLSMSGNSEIDANLIVEGSVSMSGTPTIIGNIITPSPVNFSGTANIEYKPPVSEITNQIWNTSAARPSDVRYYLE